MERPAKKRSSTVYRAREFADLAGVTVRALHHYDRVGLLEPSGRSASGYRLYTDADLARLEQIVVLKSVGLPLKGIRGLLGERSTLREVLRRQQRVLAGKRAHLDAAIEAIAAAERSMRDGGDPDWQLMTRIIKEIAMQNDTDWTKQYYTPDAQEKIEERKTAWNPELQAEVTRQWSALVADVESCLGEDPAGPRAQALAARWRKLVEGFTGGSAEIQKGLNRMWADQGNWPADIRQDHGIKPEIQAFIIKAMQATPKA
jgi:MerR family transcriptional regulator, thiopeptide resistance regulator